jgi:hypothetical protein
MERETRDRCSCASCGNAAAPVVAVLRDDVDGTLRAERLCRPCGWRFAEARDGMRASIEAAEAAWQARHAARRALQLRAAARIRAGRGIEG